MHGIHWSPKTRLVVCGVAALALAGLPAVSTAQTPSSQTGSGNDPLRKAPHHKVVTSGLDNPRQLSVLPTGNLLVAEAGHGSYKKGHCAGKGEDAMCIGHSGKVTVVKTKNGKHHRKMGLLLSGAGPDGTFATGSDGASKRRDKFYAIMTYAPPESFPEGIKGGSAGMLISQRMGWDKHKVANISRYERKHDPDGEGVDSNPYSVLALKHKVLVADAAGDSILSVRHGKVRLWHLMKEYGKKVDAVPTVLAKGKHGRILVGELHSEIPGKARVWKLNSHGKALRSWKGFTTVTGVAQAKDGTLYVSELFGGNCGFDKVPSCFPGRVTEVRPNGKRSHVDVPAPAGIVVHKGKVYVNAFSIAPAKGFGGNPAWSGQIWRMHR